MKVQLVSITQPLVGGVKSPEELLVYIARVSNPSNQLNTDTADKLLGYMIRNKHWSPFDMVNMTVEVKTSKAVSIQILRHWSIKPQEFSQRYAEVVEIEPIELRKQGATNRQVGDEVFNPHIDSLTIVDENENGIFLRASDAEENIANYLQQGIHLYKELLKAGVAKECARMILPMASQTTMYLNGSIRSWIHYLEQRTDSHAQKEHRDVAQEIKRIFMENFPMISKALGYEL